MNKENVLKVKIKKLVDSAVIPEYESDSAAGMDLVAVSKKIDKFDNVVYGTGLAFEIPVGYAGFVYPRSSVSKYDLSLANSVGVIDSDYRGEVIFKFRQTDCLDPLEYNIGDRIGQLIIKPLPKIEFEEVFDLSSTVRGSGGFGSTGSGGSNGSPMGVMS